MAEKAMPTPAAKANRSWINVMNRSSVPQAPRSPTWSAPLYPSQPVRPSPSSKKDKSSSSVSDSDMVKNLKKLICDFDQLCSINGAPLSDPRATSIRKDIEKVMPRIYALTQDETSKLTETWTVQHIAEERLRKFPGVDLDALRSTVSAERKSPLTPISAQTISPKVSPRHSLPPAPVSAPPICASGQGRSPWEIPPTIPSCAPPAHFLDAVRLCTPSQKGLLVAVKDLVRGGTGSAYKLSEPWFIPPEGLSPDELLSARGEVWRHSFAHSPQPYPSSHRVMPPHPFPIVRNASLYPHMSPVAEFTPRGIRSLTKSVSSDSAS